MRINTSIFIFSFLFLIHIGGFSCRNYPSSSSTGYSSFSCFQLLKILQGEFLTTEEDTEYWSHMVRPMMKVRFRPPLLAICLSDFSISVSLDPFFFYFKATTYFRFYLWVVFESMRKVWWATNSFFENDISPRDGRNLSKFSYYVWLLRWSVDEEKIRYFVTLVDADEIVRNLMVMGTFRNPKLYFILTSRWP